MESIELTAPFCGQLQLESHEKNTIELSYQSEGEYQYHMGIRTQIKTRQLRLNEYKNPLFQEAQDKLAAHKIIASSLLLLLPTRMEVAIRMRDGQLTARGEFAQLHLQIKEGNCLLMLTETEGQLTTRAAAVQVYPNKMEVTTVSQTLSCSTNKAPHRFEIVNRSGSVDCISE